MSYRTRQLAHLFGRACRIGLLLSGTAAAQTLSQDVADQDLVILGNEIASDWTLSTFSGIELVGFSSGEPVPEDETAAVLRVEKATGLGWTLHIKPPAPFDPLGFTTLRFAFHPGDMVPPSSPSLAVAVKPGKSLDLLQDGLIDLNLTEWQVVEVDLSVFGPSRVEYLVFLGNLVGTFYLADLRLVRALDDAPIVTSITPAQGHELGGAEVEIRGSNFHEDATAAFGGTGAARTRRVSPFLVQATTPPHPPGSVDVTITNPSGEGGILAHGFAFVPALFGARDTYVTGAGPNSVFSADLDGDGDNDLAVANWEGDTIGVLVNQRDGTFAPKVDCPAVGAPASVFGADMDGDGDSDLVVAKFSSNSVSVLMNHGDATFAPEADYPAGGRPYSIFSADLDGDGDNDLAVGGAPVTVLLNNGDGTFGERTDCAAKGGSVFIADLDGDADNDLAVGNQDDRVVSVLLGHGDGTFAPRVDYPVGGRSASVFSADLEGDGDNDLAVTTGSGASVSVLLNEGDGAFAPKVDWPAGDNPGSVFTADLDGDGDRDLAVADMGSGTVSVLLNEGDGTFAARIAYPTGPKMTWNPYSVFVSDLDGDGDSDLAVANYSSNTVSVLLNRTITGLKPPPVVTSVSPKIGSRGALVRITGRHFQGEATVTFAPPIHADGTVDVIVRNADGQADTLHGEFTLGDMLAPSVVAVTANIITMVVLQPEFRPAYYGEPIFPEVRITKDVLFAEVGWSGGQMQQLLLDIYEPVGDVEVNRPAVMFTHGGGFRGGDKAYDIYAEMPREFAQRGYVAFSINYRLADPGGEPTIADSASADALTALEWIQSRSVKYGVDPNRIVICGDSAGGAIAVNMCYRKAASVGAAACIDLWGGMYDRSHPGDWSAPIYPDHIEPGTPPTLLIHGTRDSIVPYQTSVDLADELAAAGVYYELYPLPEADHYPRDLSPEFIPVMIDFVYRVMNNLIPTAVIAEAVRASGAPATYALDQNYPNPFNSNTLIRFAVPGYQRLEMTVYNLTGQKVVTLADGPREPGAYTLRWDGRDETGRELASGVYLCRLQAEDRQVRTRRLVLLR